MGSKGNKSKKAQAKRQRKALQQRRKRNATLKARNIRRNTAKKDASLETGLKAAIQSFVDNGDAVWWVANGINYFQSDYDEGIWSPVFPEIYEEDHTLTPDTLKGWLTQHFNEEDKTWTDEGRHAAGLVMSPPTVIFVFAQRCIDAALQAEGDFNPRSPACEPVWQVFHEMKQRIIAKEAENAAAEEANAEEILDATSEEVIDSTEKVDESTTTSEEAVGS